MSGGKGGRPRGEVEGIVRGARFNSGRPVLYLVMNPARSPYSEDIPSKLAKRMSCRWRVLLLRAKGNSRAG